MALVSMPFMGIYRPSIQLGLLGATLARAGFPVRTLHANLDFAALIGADEYSLLAEHRGRLVGDWLFSVAAFGDAAPDAGAAMPVEFAADLAHLGRPPTELRDRLVHLRESLVPAYLDSLVLSYPWDRFRVVGFSSTYQQNAASFALARRLKQRWPWLITVFGGANFDGEMGPELVRTVDCIDLAVTGEGERALPGLLRALAAGTDPLRVPGVLGRVDGVVGGLPPAPPLELDDAAVPDYTEYFQRAASLALLPAAGRHRVWIPFESSRGCWWGARHHCVFCGLNGGTMRFRTRTAQRVRAELDTQARRYGSFRFEAVDNILDPAHLRELMPDLIEAGTGYELFYEVKANLTRAQTRLLAQAGVTRIQPGIESLSSHVLRLMRKGVTAAQNVNLLRWCRYYGIDVAWNLLWGFPDETVRDYTDQAAVLPHLWHLQPPGGAARIWIERFSPLYAAARAGTDAVRPERSYGYVYPPEADLDRIAYFFEHRPESGLPDETYVPLARQVAAWTEAAAADPRPVLTYRSTPGYLQIHDGRYAGREGTYTFEGPLAEVYLACVDRPVTRSGLRLRLGERLPAGQLDQAVTEFARRGLMFLDGPRVLALALPAVAGR
ncbi:RiPP maturation radical SAM C-methyltransferase [Micromonospora sp. CPCC 205561]|uniref:RiPP maturation radical SAM C-methyltransferase n=1 Tax=Micromonospora sp. CPCC 205561 TaxID=3122407 RepID=UPI002FF171CE